MPRDFDNLSQINAAYLDFLAKNGKPPKGSEDLRPFLAKVGDADALLTSPEDGAPYVVLWGVDIRKQSIARMPPPIIAHQKEGRGGRRYVLTLMGVQSMTDKEFATADFIAAKSK